MKITLNKIGKRTKEVTFIWNDTFTDYNTEKINVSQTDMQLIILSRGHEGEKVNGWKSDITN